MDAQPTETVVDRDPVALASKEGGSDGLSPTGAARRTRFPLGSKALRFGPLNPVIKYFYTMPTGRKLFLLILFALAPLALITLIANIQSASAGDAERQLLLTAANQELARRIASTVVTDEDLVRRPLAAFDADPQQAEAAPTPVDGDTPQSALPASDIETHNRGLCASISRALVSTKDVAPELHIVRANDGTHLCHETTTNDDTELSRMATGGAQFKISHDLQSVVDVIPLTDINGTKLVALLVYPVSMLQDMVDPSTRLPAYNLYLTKDDRQITLSEQLGTWLPGNTLSVTTPVGKTGANLEIGAYRKSLSRSDIISFVAPIGMWLLAGGLAWVLVNQLMLKPLREIQSSVSMYRPGQHYRPHPRSAAIASEITELEQDMADLSDMVARDKRALATGLEKQTLLTREVHHRVKNNLQIIASLLNIHSRSATTPGAIDAYRSIQRRVDALSAVHRNHFAELEENEGIALRPLLSELAANLRGTSPLDGSMSVTVKADAMQIQQDIAVPIGFLVTEIGELALLSGVGAPMKISVLREAEERMAELLIQSDSLIASDTLDHLLETRFGRVLTGLSRQLRQPLVYDAEKGSYQIRFSTLD